MHCVSEAEDSAPRFTAQVVKHLLSSLMVVGLDLVHMTYFSTDNHFIAVEFAMALDAD